MTPHPAPRDAPPAGATAAAPGSIRELTGLASDAHAAWVRGAATTAALAYAAVVLAGFVTAGPRFPQVLTECAAVVGAIVALWLERRRRAVAGGIVLALTFFLELHASVLIEGGFPIEVLLTLPLMVAAIGLLLGGPAGIITGVVTSVAIPALAWLGAWLQGRPVAPSAEPFVLFVLAAILVGAGVLMHLGLGAFRRAAHAALEGQQRASHLGRVVEETDTEVYVVERQTGRFVIVSRGARTKLGYSGEELAGLTWRDVNGWCPEAPEVPAGAPG
jgi:PAS domain-containing protein